MSMICVALLMSMYATSDSGFGHLATQRPYWGHNYHFLESEMANFKALFVYLGGDLTLRYLNQYDMHFQ